MNDQELRSLGKEILQRKKGGSFHKVGYEVLHSRGITGADAPEVLSAIGKILARQKRERRESSTHRPMLFGKPMNFFLSGAQQHEKELLSGIPEEDL